MPKVNDVAARWARHPCTIRRWCIRHDGHFARHIGGLWDIPPAVVKAVEGGTRIEDLPPLRTLAD